MLVKTLINYCSSLPEAKEDYPFGPDVQVFKIKDKLFAILTKRQGIHRINLKCHPEEALILREIFEDVVPFIFYKNFCILFFILIINTYHY